LHTDKLYDCQFNVRERVEAHKGGKSPKQRKKRVRTIKFKRE
jgi:hypothetical protein